MPLKMSKIALFHKIKIAVDLMSYMLKVRIKLSFRKYSFQELVINSSIVQPGDQLPKLHKDLPS